MNDRNLENMSGLSFKAAVKEEDRRWSEGLQELPTSSWLTSTKRYQTQAWPESRRWAHMHFTWRGHHVSIQRSSSAYLETVWIGEQWYMEGQSGVGFSESSAHFYTLEDIGNGSEHLRMTVWEWKDSASSPVKKWFRDPVGPSIVLHDNFVFFSSVENMLRYPDVRRVNITNGKDEKIIYRQPDKRVQVSLKKRSDTVFVHEANAIFQRLGSLCSQNVSIQWWTPLLKGTVLPISTNIYATDHSIVEKELNVCWPLPTNHFVQDGMMGPKSSMLVSTVCNGASALWLLDDDIWSMLWSTEDEMSDVVLLHEPTKYPTFILRRPSSPDAVACFQPIRSDGTWGLTTLLTYPEPLRLRVIAHGAAGRVGVPYTVVARADTEPRALMVEAYGAYGISGRRAYPVRWLPWLAAGYAVAYVAPRGGREKGDAWWNGGRTARNKVNTFLDTAVAIRQVQKDVGISASNTVFFGRSAGGWLAANMAQDHSDLIAAVYAEVPYVDVLATTSNPTLPLTQLEYDEFGDPLHRPAERIALSRISPVDTVPPGGPTSPLLVIRTGLHDAQVFPYEAIKWARKLRKAGWTRVYVGIDHDGGHFADPFSMLRQRAEDAALLDSAVTSKQTQTRVSYTRKIQ